MNIDKYSNTGIGLSKISLQLLEKHIVNYYKSKNFTESNPMKIIEFGSGFSTKFLVDLKLHYNFNILIESYDNIAKYAYKNTNNYNFIDIKIRPLLQCSNDNYKVMFDNKLYKSNLMKPFTGVSTYRQQNCFYNLKQSDLVGNYDVMVLDGPNGNGRNFAFLHMQNKMNKNGIIFIDDLDHYDFEQKMNSFFHTKTLYKQLKDDRINKWANGGRIGLYQLI